MRHGDRSSPDTGVRGARPAHRGAAAAADITAGGVRGEVEVEEVDLADLHSVDAFADRLLARFPAIDVLVNNAGVNSFGGPAATKQGLEPCWGVNYLAHYRLTEKLADALSRGRDPRLVNLSSLMHRFGSSDLLATVRGRANCYNNSKLAMTLHARAMAKRLPGVRCLAVNPGAVNSDIWRAVDNTWAAPIVRGLFRLLFLDTEQGARASAFAAAGTSVATGTYLAPYYIPSFLPRPLRTLFEVVGPVVQPAAVQPAPEAQDDELAAALMVYSARVCDEVMQ